MELITIARPYAQAAFEFAKEEHQLKQWTQFLHVAACVASDEKIIAFIKNPTVGKEKILETLLKAFGKRINEYQRNFIHVLLYYKRLHLLRHIFLLFERIRKEHENTLDVTVVSAFALSSAQKGKLANKLKQRMKKEISLTEIVDKSLVGGITIKINDGVIDGSVKTMVAQLRAQLNMV